LAARGMRKTSATGDRIINVLLIAALAGEGFLAGYQLFLLHTVCVFCLSVLGIYVVLSLLRVLAGHREVLAGFGALLAVLVLFSLLLPAGGSALPLDQRYVLFYSPDCRHCSEIRSELEHQRIAALHVEVKEHAATLKNLGIEHVPTLMVNGPYEKVFLTGTEAIRRYLATCGSDRVPARKTAVRTRSVGPASGPTGTALPKGTLNFFPSPGTLGQIFSPPTDSGLCKEDAKCE